MNKIQDKNVKSETSSAFGVFANAGPPDCGCSGSSVDDVGGTEAKAEAITITIDGRVIDATTHDNNIIEVAGRAKISIPAPCYRTKRKKGCCSACVIEVDGEQKFACSTTPKDGMSIVVNRDDLKEIRKERLKEYSEGIKSGNHCACSSPESDNGSCS
jgi:predicted molibdopterin-dependent oxidoreductase YjgC